MTPGPPTWPVAEILCASGGGDAGAPHGVEQGAASWGPCTDAGHAGDVLGAADPQCPFLTVWSPLGRWEPSGKVLAAGGGKGAGEDFLEEKIPEPEE